MDEAELLVFLEKLSSGSYTAEEYNVFKKRVDSVRREEYESILQLWEEVLDRRESFAPVSTKLIERIESGLNNLIPSKDNTKYLDRFKVTANLKWRQFAAAASILLLIGLSCFLLFRSAPRQLVAVNPYGQHDIPPGKNTATLILSNGHRIILSNRSNGQIARQAGVSIVKAGNGEVIYTGGNYGQPETKQLNTLATAKGETYKIELPDGTQVWLNAASSLTYPVRFNGGERKVTLTGEGYFEVAKDKKHPFKVAAGLQEVTVLGTHFNINAYTNESAVKTTLLEGSVKISSDSKDKLIKPGQQASLKNGMITVSDIDTELATAWKNNKFIFDNDRIDYIMRMVERWYNVEVVYQGTISDEPFGGAVPRYENVSEVLKILESTGKIHFKIQGRKIFVSKNAIN